MLTIHDTTHVATDTDVVFTRTGLWESCLCRKILKAELNIFDHLSEVTLLLLLPLTGQQPTALKENASCSL